MEYVRDVDVDIVRGTMMLEYVCLFMGFLHSF